MSTARITAEEARKSTVPPSIDIYLDYHDAAIRKAMALGKYEVKPWWEEEKPDGAPHPTSPQGAAIKQHYLGMGFIITDHPAKTGDIGDICYTTLSWAFSFPQTN